LLFYRQNSGATPHTRGSTQRWPAPGRVRRGYPAYAGIDRLSFYRSFWMSGLPRIRGDRPPSFRCIIAQTGATPHTRGSTFSACSRASRSSGYPAYAGIDLCEQGSQPLCKGLPRICGDRPGLALCQTPLRAATSHTRGSTFLPVMVAAANTGYPAYAGIDHNTEPVERFQLGLPRIRGDRPATKSAQYWYTRATPHTRGSTSQQTFEHILS